MKNRFLLFIVLVAILILSAISINPVFSFIFLSGLFLVTYFVVKRRKKLADWFMDDPVKSDAYSGRHYDNGSSDEEVNAVKRNVVKPSRIIKTDDDIDRDKIDLTEAEKSAWDKIVITWDTKN